ncbi:MAG: exodeoxyribonuclease VII small subunit [Planctomycetota bacterium]|nr:exodeoxyribonuclease VII small subunit [Planctomycetota bacterium]
MARKPARPADEGGEDTRKIPFEDKLAELEEIVRQLEDGEKSLDESLALYERGVASLKDCHAILNHAEKRIKMLVKKTDGAVELADVEALSGESAEAGDGGEGDVPEKSRLRKRGDARKPEAAEAGDEERDDLFGGS